MNRIKRFIFGSKLKSSSVEAAGQSMKESKMTIEESIRRYEQLCAE